MNRFYHISYFLLSALALFTIQYLVPRTAFFSFMGLYFLAFVLYGLWIKFKPASSLKFILFSALAFRLILLFAPPNLSDDFYRFIWDAQLLLNNYNPYLYLPNELMNEDLLKILPLSSDLFNNLNSPNYYTCYPPVHQYLMALFTFLSDGSIWGASVSMKAGFLILDMCAILIGISLLKKLNKNPKLIALYALNPLVIIELTGNLHTEIFVVLFMFLCIYGLLQKRLLLAALAFALAIASKLLPLLFLPFIIVYLDWKKGTLFTAYTFVFCVFLFLPFYNIEILHNFLNSITLFINNFEFNASVYYILRWVAFQFTGYNVIETLGWVLKLLSAFLIAALVLHMYFFKRKQKLPISNLFGYLILALSVYLFCATVVHPWYIIPLIAYATFSKIQFPITWSALIPLSYAAYQSSEYHENLYLVAVEYLVLFTFIIWSFYSKSQNPIKVL